MEGIKERWSPVFFFFFLLIVLSVFSCHSRRLTSCSSLSELPSLVVWHQTRLGTESKSRRSEWEKDEEEQQSNYLLLADIYPALLTPHPMSRLLFVHSFLHTFLALIRQTVYCLVICLSQFCLLSSVFHDHPTSRFAFLYPAFHLTLPYSTWFYFFPPRCLIRLLSFILRPSPCRPHRCSPFLHLSQLNIYRKFPVHPLLPAYPVLFLRVTLQNNIMWHMYWVLTLFSSPFFWSLWYELTHVLTQ